MPIARSRREYSGQPLLESRSPADPLLLFRRWLAAALRDGGQEPHAMTLATVDARGRPRARIVLMKQAHRRGTTIHTNQKRAKARELLAHAPAALVACGPPLHGPVRSGGTARRVGAGESDAYFATRPRGARLGAWASPQSRVLPSRQWLERSHARMVERFGTEQVPRPPHWGGF